MKAKSAAIQSFLNFPDPLEVEYLGDPNLLRNEKIGLFCSVRCPGGLILAAYDYARTLRDNGATVISGFHSPVEKECLRILLRGKQPIIICPARSLVNMRIPPEWRSQIEKGRLLLLSPFAAKKRRATAGLARERNQFVGRVADNVCFVYAAPGGSLANLQARLADLGKPISKLEAGLG